MIKTTHGTIRGKTIELDEDLGVAEGQAVEVRVRVVVPGEQWGAGIQRTAGALADDPEWDAVMAQVHAERKRERRALPEDE